MPLKTKIISPNGETCACSINEISYKVWDEPRFEVQVKLKGRIIGMMQYSFEDNNVHIHRVVNYTNKEAKYKHVGLLLIEYAFRKSIKNNKGGRIELNAIKNSAAAYYKMGLRKKSSISVLLMPLISEYLARPSKKLKTTIKSKKNYSLLVDYAAKRLNKEPDLITFEECILHGQYAPENVDFEAKIATGEKISQATCYRLGMQATMYFPPETIKEKKLEFFNQPPIGSLYFFSEKHALTCLKNMKIKKLVETKQLDPSNAVELEAKMEPNDPRLDILLSPIGLKLMKKNYISAWYIGVYFHNLKDLEAIISEKGLKAFKNGHFCIEELIGHVGLAKKIIEQNDVDEKKSSYSLLF